MRGFFIICAGWMFDYNFKFSNIVISNDVLKIHAVESAV